MSLFQPVVDAQLSTLIVSNVVTADFGTDVSVTVVAGNGTILRNGVSVVSPTTVNVGDTLAIRDTSSSSYLTPVYTTVQIGNDYHAFAIVTQQDQTELVPYAPFSGVLPFDLTRQQDGSTYVPNTANNKITKYSSDFDTTIASIGVPTTLVNGSSTNDCIVVSNYFSNSISYIDTTTNQVIATIAVGTHPSSLTYTPTSASDRTSLTWVTLAGENKVVLVSSATHSITNTFPTGVKPIASACSVDGTSVFVANNGDNTVTHFTYANGSWAGANIAVSAAPYGVAIDLNGNAWVTLGNGKVSVISSTTNAILSTFAVRPNPRGITIDQAGVYAYVTSSTDNFVQKYKVSDYTLAGSVATGRMPMEIVFRKDGKYVVTCFADSLAQVFDPNGTKVDEASLSKYPYGLSVDPAGNIWSCEYYDNTPAYYALKDRTPAPFFFTPQADLEPETTYYTENITVSGLDYVMPVYVGNALNARLFVNDQVQSSATSVANGNTVRVEFTTPAAFEAEFEFPVFIGNTYATVSGQTRAGVRTPKPVTFTAVDVNGPYTYHESNTVTIDGLGAGGQIYVTLNEASWKIRINGVLNDLPALVTQGDSISLVGYADMYDDRLSYDVTIMAIVDVDLVPFGTFSMKVPVLEPCIKWEFSTPPMIDSKYVKWVYADHLATAPAFMPVVMSSQVVANDSEYVKDVSVARALTGAAEYDVFTPGIAATSDQSKYVRDVLFVGNTSGSTGFTTRTPKAETVSPASTYIFPPSYDTRTVESKYVRNSVSDLHDLNVAYERNTASVQREAYAEYQRDVRMVQRDVAPAYNRGTIWSLRARWPEYVKTTSDNRTTLAACERNTTFDLRAVDPKYQQLGTRDHLGDELQYTKAAAIAAPSTPALYTVAIKTEAATIPGPSIADYVTRAVRDVHTSVGASYLVVDVHSKVSPAMSYVMNSQNRLSLTAMVPEKIYYIHNVDYADSMEQQGTYATAEEAIAAGKAEGYTDVRAMLLPNGGYMWNVPIPCNIPPSGGGSDGGIAKPYKWYVHGG